MLILDSLVTNSKNLAATEMARKAGVGKVSLPPHTTHRLHPDESWMWLFSDRLENTMMMH